MRVGTLVSKREKSSRRIRNSKKNGEGLVEVLHSLGWPLSCTKIKKHFYTNYDVRKNGDDRNDSNTGTYRNHRLTYQG